MSTNNSEAQNSGMKGQDSPKSIIRSTSLLSVGTLTSRIFGFLRDVVIARMFGTKYMADAFFVALRIPSLFRDLVGEGATNAAVVPVFSEYKVKKSQEEFWKFINIVLCLAFIVLSLITILGILFAPVLVRVIVPGFMADPEKLLLTIRLTKTMFPYLIFIGLTAYCIGVLYTYRSFLAPAFSSCLFNISIILCALLVSPKLEEPVFGLAIGVLLGGFAQLLIQIKPIINTGVKFKLPKSLNHPGARRIGKLLVPRMIGSGVYQMTVLIDTFCASLASIVGAGGISAIYYSNRIIQFPMGIFGVALASAVLPSLSGHATRKDIDSVKKTIVFSLENIFFIMCPTTVVLLLLSHPIIRVLFERGEFGGYSTYITGGALTYYAIGLFSFGGIKILVTAFHSLQDTKTPVYVAAVCLVINAALNFILMVPLKVGGIAMASSIAGTIDFLILFYIMDKKLEGLNGGLLGYFTRVTICSGLTGIFIFFLWENFLINSEVIKLFTIMGLGYLFYWGSALLFKVEQAHKIKDSLVELWKSKKK